MSPDPESMLMACEVDFAWSFNFGESREFPYVSTCCFTKDGALLLYHVMCSQSWAK